MYFLIKNNHASGYILLLVVNYIKRRYTQQHLQLYCLTCVAINKLTSSTLSYVYTKFQRKNLLQRKMYLNHSYIYFNTFECIQQSLEYIFSTISDYLNLVYLSVRPYFMWAKCVLNRTLTDLLVCPTFHDCYSYFHTYYFFPNLVYYSHEVINPDEDTIK